MEMRRFFLLASSLIFLLSGFGVSRAETILVVKSADLAPFNEAVNGFKKACDCRIREITVSDLAGDDTEARVADINPDAVLAVGIEALLWTLPVRDKPIVYSMISAPPSSVLNKKNVSGVSMSVSAEKYVSALLDLFTEVKKVGIIYNPSNSAQFVEDARHYAESRGVELIAKKVSKQSEIPPLIDSLFEKIDVFMMVPDPTVFSREAFNYLLLTSFRKKTPVFTFSQKFVELGATAGLIANPSDIGMQSADIIHKLLYQKDRRQIKTEMRKTDLAINRKMVSKLGVRLTDSAARRAVNVD